SSASDLLEAALDCGRRRTAFDRTPGNRVLGSKNRDRVGAKRAGMPSQLRDAQVLERPARFGRLADYHADDFMRPAKRSATADQVFREICGQRKSSRCRSHAFGIESQFRPEL